MRFTVQDFLLQKGCRNAAIVVVIQMSQPCAVVVSPARFAGGCHDYCLLLFQAPQPRQAGSELIAVTCSPSTAAAHCLINRTAFKLSPCCLLMPELQQFRVVDCLGSRLILLVHPVSVVSSLQPYCHQLLLLLQRLFIWTF